MARTAADDLWDMLAQAGVKRVYGIVGDALNPTLDALTRHDDIEFIHVRHEEWGAFAASAEAQLTGEPVAVCGTAGPGVTHLLNGLLDAKHARPVIAIAGDVDTEVIDTGVVEEVNPYDLFRTASLYTGRAVNPKQAPTVFSQALTIATEKHGPTVVALPGDVSASESPHKQAPAFTPAHTSVLTPASEDVQAVADLVNDAEKVVIFGGEGARGGAAQTIELGQKLAAPIGYTLKAKNFLEVGNPNAAGMTGLLGYGGLHASIVDADVVLLLGTDFPFPGFLDRGEGKIIQVDRDPEVLGRRVELEMGLAADVRAFVDALLPLVRQKTDTAFLDAALKENEKSHKKAMAYVKDGEQHTSIRPEFLAATLNELMSDDAILAVDTGTPVMWVSHQMTFGGQHHQFGSYSWASMANASPYGFGAALACPGRQVVTMCGDGGFQMLALGDLLTEIEHKTPVVHIVLNNSKLDFVEIEMQEAGQNPAGRASRRPTTRRSLKPSVPRASGSKTPSRCANSSRKRSLMQADRPLSMSLSMTEPSCCPRRSMPQWSRPLARASSAGPPPVKSPNCGKRPRTIFGCCKRKRRCFRCSGC